MANDKETGSKGQGPEKKTGEEKGKKKEPEAKQVKKRKKRKPSHEERLARTEENVGKLMELFSSHDLPDLTQELKEAKGGLAEFNEILGTATESLGSLTEAFELLEGQIRNGNIKSLKDLEKLMGRITRGMEAKYEAALARQGKLGDLLEKEGETQEKIRELRKEGAAEMAAIVAASNAASEGIRNLAEAAEASGLGFPAGIEKPPVWGKDSDDDIESWFKEKLKKMVIMKTPFAENWRMSWDLERFLASIPKEEREAYLHYAGWFDRVRTEHACHLGYDGAANVEAIQGVLGNLSLSTIEAALRDEDVVEQLYHFQEDAEKVVELRAEQERLKEKGRNKEAEAKEEEMNEWLKRIKHRMNGSETQVDQEGKPKFDEKKGLAKIEAGRMFMFLGMTAGYDIADLSGGDFFMARVNHLYNMIQGKTGKEGDRWWKRDRLVRWMKLDIGEDKKEIDPETGKPRRITGLEVFTHKFGGGLLASVLDRDKGQLEKFGLRWHRKWDRPGGNRLINVIKIVDKEKLTQIDFEGEGIARENQLSGDVIDAARVADEVRAAFLGHNGYLDRPTWESFMKFADLFKHLRGNADEIGFGRQKPRGGTEKDRLMALMHRDWLQFFKGPGKTTRFFASLAQLHRLKRYKDYSFIRPGRAIDPETGEEMPFGKSFADSDGESLGFGRSLNSVEVHGYVDEAVRTACYSKQYAEGILRNEIKLFKIVPGIGPVRATQEVIDEIGVGGFVGGFLVFIFAPILEFLRRAAKQLETS